MNIKLKTKNFIHRFKRLNGDPHYVALGMAIGIFVAVTPTIPFHTLIALSLAFICRASKPAAAIGVWISNPVTIPVFYYGSYKVGMHVMGICSPFDENRIDISELLNQGVEITVAMITGGIILGVIPGIAAYWITRKIVTAIRPAATGKPSEIHPFTDKE